MSWMLMSGAQRRGGSCGGRVSTCVCVYVMAVSDELYELDAKVRRAEERGSCGGRVSTCICIGDGGV